MKSRGKSETMRIDIPPYLLEEQQVTRPGIAKRAKPVRAADLALRRTSQIPIEDADFKALFQGLYDAAFITDLPGRIVDANARASHLFQYSRSEFRDRRIFDIVAGLDDTILGTIRKNLEQDQFTLVQARCLRKDESQFPCEISTSILHLTTRDYLCFFIRDIEARREAEEAVRRARDELEAEVRERTRINEELVAEIHERERIQAELQSAIVQLKEHDKAKSEFVSNVSHELKTPLTSITYSAGNLLKGVAGELSPGAQEYLGMIREDCQRLRRTVDDILDMSRLEANTLRLDRVKVDFPRFVRRTVESMRMQVEAEALALQVTVPDLPVFVECDPQKMERVFFNLMKNAIKYNVPGGGIEVELAQSAESPDWVFVHVIDSGIGIEAQHLSRVTERFYRVGEHVSGAGLGLSICKELLERHGGGIALASPPPGRLRGTVVTATLPAVAPPCVWFVSDNESVQVAMATALDAAGYRVTGARHVDDLLAGAGNAIPDIVLVDWTGPGMEGGVAIAKLKGSEEVGRVPVLVLSLDDGAEAKAEILGGLGIPVVASVEDREVLVAALEGAVLDRRRREG